MMQLDPVRFQNLLALNQANVPDVGALDETGLRELLEMTDFLKYVELGESMVGFIQGLLPGQTYRSLNYRWFAERYEHFLYIDRIAIAEPHRGKGIGRELYRLAVDFCRQMGLEQILLEINTEPPNPGSHRFHERLGFETIDELQHAPGKTVCMYRLGIN